MSAQTTRSPAHAWAPGKSSTLMGRDGSQWGTVGPIETVMPLGRKEAAGLAELAAAGAGCAIKLWAGSGMPLCRTLTPLRCKGCSNSSNAQTWSWRLNGTRVNQVLCAIAFPSQNLGRQNQCPCVILASLRHLSMAIADRRHGRENGLREQSESASYNGYNALASSEPKAASIADCVFSQRLRLKNKSSNATMSSPTPITHRGETPSNPGQGSRQTVGASKSHKANA